MSLKAIDILETLAEYGTMTVSGLSTKVGFSKSTVYRILSDLVERQYVLKNESNKHYRLGFKLLYISQQILDSIKLRDIAREEMVQLAHKSNETVHLVWLENNEGIYIDKIDTKETIGLLSKVGKRLPLHSSASGKAILAYMSRERLEKILERGDLEKITPNTITDKEKLKEELATIRGRGYSFDEEENREGVICVGAPIVQSDEQVVAAISLSGPAFRFDLERASSFGQDVKEAALSISKQLGLFVLSD